MKQKYTSFRMFLLLGASSLAITISFNANADQTNDYGQAVPTQNTVGRVYIDPILYPDYEYSENFQTPYFKGGGLRVPPDGLFVEPSFFLEGPLKEISDERVFYNDNYNLDGTPRVDLNALYVANEVTSHSHINQANGYPALSIYIGNLIEGTYTPGSPPSVDILNKGDGATTVLYQNYAQGAQITNSDHGKFYIDNNTVIEASINNNDEYIMFIEGNYAESVTINNYNNSFMLIKGNVVNNALINNGSSNTNNSSRISIHYNTATDTILKNDNG